MNSRKSSNLRSGFLEKSNVRISAVRLPTEAEPRPKRGRNYGRHFLFRPRRRYSKVSFHFCMLVQRGHPIIFVVVFSGLLFPFVLPCISACSFELSTSFPPCSFCWAARAPSFSLRSFIFRCFLFSKGHKAFVFAQQLITRLAVLVQI